MKKDKPPPLYMGQKPFPVGVPISQMFHSISQKYSHVTYIQALGISTRLIYS